MPNEWYYLAEIGPVGPLTPEDVRSLVQAGRIVPETSIRRGEDGKWHRADRIRGLPFGESTAPRNIKGAIEKEDGLGKSVSPRPSGRQRTPLTETPAQDSAERSTEPQTQGRTKRALYAAVGVVIVFLFVLLYALIPKSYSRSDDDRAAQGVASVKRNDIVPGELKPTIKSDEKTIRPADKLPTLALAPTEEIAATQKSGHEKTADRLAPSSPLSTLEPPKQVLVADFEHAFRSNGFEFVSADTLAQFIRYRTKVNADKVDAGDQFDRIEIERQSSQHRSVIASGVFQLKDIRIQVVDGIDVEKEAFLLRCSLPFRLDTNSHRSSHDERSNFSGCLSGFNIDSAANSGLENCWFLKKGGILAPCGSYAFASAVLRENGHLYVPEGTSTDLILKINFDTASSIARSPGDYTVTVIVEKMRWEQPLGDWGFYERKSLLERRWDCGYLINWNRTGAVSSEIPLYFRPERIGFDHIPRMTLAHLLSVELIANGDKTIGTFTEQLRGRELILPKPHLQHGDGSDIKGAFSGVWKSVNGATYALSDDGTTVAIKLKSEEGKVRQLEGTLTRTGEKWKEHDVLKGSLDVVFEDDPLNKGLKGNVRKLVVTRAVFNDEKTFRLIFKSVIWNAQGKEIRRQPETLDLIRDATDGSKNSSSRRSTF